MKVVVFDRCGPPEEVLEVRDVPRPEPGAGQVRVRMLASPINPSDLLYVRGAYGKVPRTPCGAGFEGVGVVDAVGRGLLRLVRGLKPGRRVAVINGAGGNWAEYVVVPARQAVPVPDGVADEQAATFFVNPVSALAMVRHVLRVPRGAWLLQTAAGSQLGRMVIRLGRRHGFRTINVVRRREQAEELKKLGDAVVCTADESVTERAAALTGGAGVGFVLDAVGGATGSEAAKTMGPGGRMIVYGTLAGEPMAVDPRFLIVGQKRVEGFWLSEWAPRQGVWTMLDVFREVGRLLREGVLTSEVGGSFPLDQVRDAARQAAQAGRQGKVLLRVGD